MQVAEDVKAAVVTVRVVSVVYRLMCYFRVEKLVAHTQFRARHTTSHPGFLDNPSHQTTYLSAHIALCWTLYIIGYLSHGLQLKYQLVISNSQRGSFPQQTVGKCAEYVKPL